MFSDLEQAAVARVLATYRGGSRTPPGAAPEARHTVRVGPIAISVPAAEVERAAGVLQALDALGVVPARKLAQLFPERAPSRSATLQTVLAWMRGQRAEGGP